MTRTGVFLSEKLRFSTCDVFTEQAFGGNPLAIVEAADGLSTEQMLTITREFNLSETIFVQRPVSTANTAKVRIFCPRAELPFAGHPTVGCAVHLALLDAPEGDFETEIRLEENAGLVPVSVQRSGSRVLAEFRAPVLPHAPAQGTCPPDDLLAAALGLHPQDIGFGTHRPGLWQGGPAFLYVPLGSLEALGQANLQEPAWSQVQADTLLPDIYIYTPTKTGFQARMFAPSAGIPEDPATGSASAVLAAQLHTSGALTPGETRIDLRQGVEMGRPSDIGLRVLCDGEGAVEAIYVSGSAVPISSGQIRLP